MPNFFMREISVVRLIPMRAAVPWGPPTRQLVTFRVRKISSRSFQLNLVLRYTHHVDELVEEGSPFEADVVPGVEHADNNEKKRSGHA